MCPDRWRSGVRKVGSLSWDQISRHHLLSLFKMLFVTFDLKRMSVKSRSEQQLQDAAAAAASLPKWWRLRPLLWRRLN